jgi:hypothetical protein
LDEIKLEVDEMKQDELRPKLVASIFSAECSELNRQLKNIDSFRKPRMDI